MCTHDGVVFYVCEDFSGGISLGNYIIVSKIDDKLIKHEYGHQIQSRYLGLSYLLIIGLPSLIWAALYGWVISYKKHDYYDFYTEKWANKLAGLEDEEGE